MKTQNEPINNFRFFVLGLFVISFSLISHSCQQGPDRGRGRESTTGTAWENQNDTVSTTIYVRENRQSEISDYENQFSQVEERIEIIRHRADTIVDDSQIIQHEKIGNLEQQRLQAEERLRKLRQAENEDVWERTEEEVERTLNDLELAVEQAENELD